VRLCCRGKGDQTSGLSSPVAFNLQSAQARDFPYAAIVCVFDAPFQERSRSHLVGERFLRWHRFIGGDSAGTTPFKK